MSYTNDSFLKGREFVEFQKHIGALAGLLLKIKKENADIFLTMLENENDLKQICEFDQKNNGYRIKDGFSENDLKSQMESIKSDIKKLESSFDNNIAYFKSCIDLISEHLSVLEEKSKKPLFFKKKNIKEDMKELDVSNTKFKKNHFTLID